MNGQNSITWWSDRKLVGKERGLNVRVVGTLRALVYGTFLQTLPELVTPLTGHFLSLFISFICAQSSTEAVIVQELCESRGGRPELSVLTSLLVSVDVKNY